MWYRDIQTCAVVVILPVKRGPHRVAIDLVQQWCGAIFLQYRRAVRRRGLEFARRSGCAFRRYWNGGRFYSRHRPDSRFRCGGCGLYWCGLLHCGRLCLRLILICLQPGLVLVQHHSGIGGEYPHTFRDIRNTVCVGGRDVHEWRFAARNLRDF